MIDRSSQAEGKVKDTVSQSLKTGLGPMAARKRRIALPKLEPMERRELLSGLMIALQATTQQLTPTQVTSIVSNLAEASTSGQAGSTAAGTGNASVGGPNNRIAKSSYVASGQEEKGVAFTHAPYRIARDLRNFPRKCCPCGPGLRQFSRSGW